MAHLISTKFVSICLIFPKDLLGFLILFIFGWGKKLAPASYVQHVKMRWIENCCVKSQRNLGSSFYSKIKVSRCQGATSTLLHQCFVISTVPHQCFVISTLPHQCFVILRCGWTGADTVERFHIFVHLLFVLVHNLVKGEASLSAFAMVGTPTLSAFCFCPVAKSSEWSRRQIY